MKLKGKCKIDFEEWFEKTYSRELVYSTMNETLIMTLPIPFVYGVYVDYFDSVGIKISIDNFPKPVFGAICLWINDGFIEEYKTREEARTEAIEKANEIRNKQLNK